MKKLHEFTVSKEVEVDDVQISKDALGVEIKTTRKIKNLVPHKFFLAKPTRALHDDADLFFAVKLSEGIKAGLLTRQQLAKRYANDGGSLSEPEKQNYTQLHVKLLEKQSEYQKLSIIPEGEKTEADKESLKKVMTEMEEIRQTLQEYELSQMTLFDQTAESRARNKTVLWWLMFLCYSEDGEGKVQPYFGEGSYEERLAKHDELADMDDTFTNSVINRFLLYVSYWYFRGATKPEDFAQLDVKSLEEPQS